MWVIFICSAMIIAILAMIVCWIGFEMLLKAKVKIKEFENEEQDEKEND